MYFFIICTLKIIKVKEIWGDTLLFTIVNTISNILSIHPMLELTNSSIILAVFYIVIGLITATIFLIFYAQYSMQRSNSVLLWSSKLLSIWISMFITIFYLPFLEILFAVLECTNTSDGLVFDRDNSIKCFQGIHWIHAIFSIIFIVFAVAIGILFSLIFYENRMQAGDETSRLSSYYEVFMIIYKTGLVLIHLFTSENTYKWIMCIYMGIISVILCLKYAYNKRFYLGGSQKVSKCYMILQIWLAAVFIYASISKETNNMEGSLEILIYGSILIIIAVYLDREKNWEELLCGKLGNISPDIILRKISQFNSLVIARHEDDQSGASLILKGYSIQHSMICTKEQCPLRMYTGQVKKAIKKEHKNLLGENRSELNSKSSKEMTKNTQLLLSHMDQLYCDGISMFSKSNSLRLAYSLFLIEVMNNQSTALEELAAVENNSPTFEEQCLIYRYKQIIKDELISSKKDDTERINITSAMAYESHYCQFKEKIEKSGIMHVQFWGMLLDEVPDLSKLRNLGYKIEDVIYELDHHWNKMQELDPDVPKVLKLYATFMEQVLNDKETSNSLTERIKLSSIKKLNINKRKAQAANTSNINAISSEGDPCICISGQQNKLGIITSCNLAVCRTFGYSKKELLGFNINILMPDLFAKQHNDILLRDLQNSRREIDHDVSRKERKIYAKTKTGYIIPLWLSLLSRPTLLNESNYIGLIHLDRTSVDANSMHLLLNTNGYIVGMSSSASLLTGLYHYMLRYSRLNIALLCPGIDITDLLSKKSEVQSKFFLPDLKAFEGWSSYQHEVTAPLLKDFVSSKNVIPQTFGEEAKLRLPRDEIVSSQNEDTIEIKKGTSWVNVNLHVEALEISQVGQVGYAIKITFLTNEKSETIVRQDLSSGVFQFRYDARTDHYIREYMPEKPIMPAKPDSREILQKYSSSVKIKSNESSSKRGKDRLPEVFDQKLTSKEIIKEICILERAANAFFEAILPKVRQIASFLDGEPSSVANSILNENLANLLKKQCTDYGQDIRTYRIGDKGTFDEVKDQPLQVLMLGGEVQQEYCSEEDYDRSKTSTDKKATFLIANNIKGRKSLESALTQGKKKELSWITGISCLLFVGIFALAIVNYIYLTEFFDSINLRVKLIDLSYTRILYELSIMYNVRELYLVKVYFEK